MHTKETQDVAQIQPDMDPIPVTKTNVYFEHIFQTLCVPMSDFQELHMKTVDEEVRP